MSSRIVVTPARRTHILDGDATGGGHGPGRGISRKSEFPAEFTDDEIIDGAEAIANDPSRYSRGIIPTGGRYVCLTGAIRGQQTRVVVDPVRKEVVTAYPLGIAPNP